MRLEDHHKSSEITLAYDKNDLNVICSFSLYADTNRLDSISEYQYDEKDRIVFEKIYEYNRYFSELVRGAVNRLESRRTVTMKELRDQAKESQNWLSSDFKNPPNLFTYPNVITHQYFGNKTITLFDEGHEKYELALYYDFVSFPETRPFRS